MLRGLLVFLLSFFLMVSAGSIGGGSASIKHPAKPVQERDLVSSSMTSFSVVKNHAAYAKSTEKKHFSGASLGFVTPWNNHGYDVAKIFNRKLDYVAPVWLQIARSEDLTSFSVRGTHDIDQNWISDVRGAKEAVLVPKIVPRFLFDGWAMTDFSNLFDSKTSSGQLIQTIVDLCVEFKFDGVVLDHGYLNFNSFRDGYIEFMQSLAERLHGEQMELILVIPAMRGAPSDAQLFSSADFVELSEFVDRFSLMTYDFSHIQRPGPNAPLSWVTQCVMYLIPPHLRGSDLGKKLLIGLNFYGNDFPVNLLEARLRPQHGPTAILGPAYVQLLKKHKPSFSWDTSSHEHSFTYADGGVKHEVFFPSLKSIADRLKLAEDLGAGVAIWELGQGLDYFYDLL